MPFASRAAFAWRLRTRTLTLGPRTLLIGIVNVTPDSFSDGGRFNTPQSALDQALRLLADGADLLDLGAESTRPGSTPVAAEEERRRLLPALEAILKAAPETILSVDTYHATTASMAIERGAEIVNDVSGLLWDPLMAQTLAELHPGAILMHTRGRPTDWAIQPPIPRAEVLPTVREGLHHTLTLAQAAGIAPGQIVLDPGFGFGKRGEENMTLHAGLDRLAALGYPLLVGTSRKRFLTAGLSQPTEEQRAHATTASSTVAILAGAHILRVHDAAAARAGAQLADRLLAAAALSETDATNR